MALPDRLRAVDARVLLPVVPSVGPPPWTPDLGPVRPLVPEPREDRQRAVLAVALGVLGVGGFVVSLVLGTFSLLQLLYLPAAAVFALAGRRPVAGSLVALRLGPVLPEVVDRRRHVRFWTGVVLVLGLVECLGAGLALAALSPTVWLLLHRQTARLRRAEQTLDGRLVRLVRRSAAPGTSRTYLLG